MNKLTPEQEEIKKDWEAKGFKMEFSTIPIRTLHTVSGEGQHMVTVEEHPLIKGVIASGKTKEEADLQARLMLNIMLSYYQKEVKTLGRLAIFQGNRSKNQIWFKIIGIGLMIYIRPKDYKPKKYKSTPKGLWIGNRIRITILNSWKDAK